MMRWIWLLVLLGCGAAPDRSPPNPALEARSTPAAGALVLHGADPYSRMRRSQRFRFDVDAKAQLAGQRATVTWTLTVEALKGDREAEFYLDAPPGIAIDQLWLDLKPGELAPGRIAPAWSAAEVYERVTTIRIDPALLERIDDRRYRLRIFPMNRKRVVRLRYHSVLPATADGRLLQIPRPFLAREPNATINGVRLTVDGRTYDHFQVRLPFASPRAETLTSQAQHISQFQVVPALAGDTTDRPLVAALDTGYHTTPQESRPKFKAARCLKGDARVRPCATSAATTTWTRLEPAGATDLVGLLEAAAPIARSAKADIVLVTPGHDRWADLPEIIAALPRDLRVHVQPAGPHPNLGALAHIAAAGRGQMLLNAKNNRLAEAPLENLRIEMLDGTSAEWLPLPQSAIAGAPLTLTAQHIGPIRARLHGTQAGKPFVVELPTPQPVADQGLAAIWQRSKLNRAWSTAGDSAHEKAALKANLVTRSTSLAVFEREQDYRAAQQGQPDLAIPQPGPQRVVITQERIQIVDKVYSKRGSARLRPRSMPLLHEVAEVLKQYPGIHIALIGHTDNTERNPVSLGLARAFTVQRELVGRGVEANRLQVRTHGANQPIMLNDSPQNRAHNRRTEFRITQVDGEEYPHALLPIPVNLSRRDRIGILRALLKYTDRDAGGDLNALRARLTPAEQLAYLAWIHEPDELISVIDTMNWDRAPRWALRGILHLLIERKDWPRLASIAPKNLNVLSGPDRIRYIAQATTPVFDICRRAMPTCTKLITHIAKTAPERAKRLAALALRLQAYPSAQVYRYSSADDPARLRALTRFVDRPVVTHWHFRELARRATELGHGALACRAWKRSQQLSLAPLKGTSPCATPPR